MLATPTVFWLIFRVVQNSWFPGGGMARRAYATAALVAVGAGITFVSASAGMRDPSGELLLVTDAGGVAAMVPEMAAPVCPDCIRIENGAARVARGGVLPPFVVDSKAAIVFDDSCGEVLYGKNEHMRLPPASLTKMLTALVAVEQVTDLDQPVPIDVSGSEMAVKSRSSVMGLEPGMQVTFRDLLFGLMLPSGNDASLAIAAHVAGSTESFVAAMNAKVGELGLTDSQFANTHGLDNPAQYSTAHDLVVIGRAMMQNPLAAEIARTPRYEVGDISMVNGNKLLANYAGTYGVKIGYTSRAAHTIVAAAEREGRSIYVAVLGSKVSYVDVTRLLDWAFLTTPRSC